MSKKNYYLKKDSKSGEIVYMEFDKIKGYNITPKSDVYDAIKVDKIVFINPSFSEKIIKKKIDIKVRKLLRELKTIDEDEDEGSNDSIRETLMEAERLKLNLIKNYCKFLGVNYQTLTLKKIQIIINQLRLKLYNNMNRQRNIFPNDLFYLDEEEYRGRSR
ncbi:MAG: hypothetical protein VZS44_01620 [Bacilli bacterium]|nr:hypothetical protein [Bacilli bacterium]